MNRIYIEQSQPGTIIKVLGVFETDTINGEIIQIVMLNYDLVMVEYLPIQKKTIDMVYMSGERKTFEVDE